MAEGLESGVRHLERHGHWLLDGRGHDDLAQSDAQRSRYHSAPLPHLRREGRVDRLEAGGGVVLDGVVERVGGDAVEVEEVGRHRPEGGKDVQHERVGLYVDEPGRVATHRRDSGPHGADRRPETVRTAARAVEEAERHVERRRQTPSVEEFDRPVAAVGKRGAAQREQDRGSKHGGPCD